MEYVCHYFKMWIIKLCVTLQDLLLSTRVRFYDIWHLGAIYFVSSIGPSNTTRCKFKRDRNAYKYEARFVSPHV